MFSNFSSTTRNTTKFPHLCDLGEVLFDAICVVPTWEGFPEIWTFMSFYSRLYKGE